MIRKEWLERELDRQFGWGFLLTFKDVTSVETHHLDSKEEIQDMEMYMKQL